MLHRLIKQVLGRQRPQQERPRLSFITCSPDDARYAGLQSSIAGRVTGFSYELIRITNARSLSEGYNRGMDRSRGDILIFCHDDIEFLHSDFAQRLVAQLEEHDIVGVAGTSLLVDGYWGSAGQPHLYGQVLQQNQDRRGYTLYMFDHHDRPIPSIQGLDGLFIAARRQTALQLRFDEERFDGFHLYDADFSFRAHLAGMKVGVCRDILIFHNSHGDKDESWKRYMAVFADKFREVLPRQTAPGELYALIVTLNDKAGALPSFLEIRGNPAKYMEWTGVTLV